MIYCMGGVIPALLTKGEIDMIQVYSTGIASTANQVISWANRGIQRGTTATLAADNQAINLNAPGVYEVSVNGYGTTTAAGTFGFQLNGDGNAIVRAAGSITTDAGEIGTVAFSTLIAVNGVYGSGTKAALTLTYTGGAGTITLVNMTVKKVA